MSLNLRFLEFSTVATKRCHQRKLEYLFRFTGYGAEHGMWQHDVSKCAELVQEYWDRKPVTQRCHASVCVAYRGKRPNQNLN